MTSIPTSSQVFIPPDLVAKSLCNIANKSFSPLLLEGETMGTYWKLNILVEKMNEATGEKVRRIVSSCFDLVIEQMSHWDRDSILSEINRSKPNRTHQIPKEFFHVLETALAIAKLTDGAYDPTVGLEVSLAGFGPDEDLFCSVAAGVVAGDWSTIHLDSERHTITHQGVVHLDLSSIAKGYAIDLACAELEKSGFNHYLLEIGGEIRGGGCKATGEPWWAEISTGEAKQSAARMLIAMSGVSLATSGVTVNRKVENGKVNHHLLDTDIRASVSSDLVAVSVISETCMLADAWATALFTLGVERGIEMANRLELAAIFLEQGERVCISEACEPFLTE